jgi:hypothetical protein
MNRLKQEAHYSSLEYDRIVRESAPAIQEHLETERKFIDLVKSVRESQLAIQKYRETERAHRDFVKSYCSHSDVKDTLECMWLFGVFNSTDQDEVIRP